MVEYTMTKKAYSYVRFSSPEQAKGRSLQRQREACEAYCRTHGLTLATSREYTFLDAGASGFKGEHVGVKGQLARFIKLVEDGTIERGSTLIVESLDRLSRQDVRTALQQFLRLTEAGIRVVTLSDGAVYDEKLDVQELLLSIFVMSRAHEESSTKSARIRDAMGKKHELARAQMKPMGRIAPLWLDFQQGKYVENKENVAVVRRIFELALAGRGKAQIAKTLNIEGIPSFKRTTWGPSSVDKVLKNRAVLGEYQPRSIQGSPDGKPRAVGEPILDYFPRIVDQVTFHAVAEASRSRKVAHATRQSKEFNVWQGVAKCVHCGGPLHLVNKGTPPKGAKYLHCYAARKSLCDARAIRYEPLELVFRATVTRLDALALVKDNAAKLQRELEATNDMLLSKRQAKARLVELLISNFSSALAEAAQTVDNQLASLVLRQTRLQGELAAEDGMSFAEFNTRLDEHLKTYAGRDRANALLKRLGVFAYFDRDQGCAVTQDSQLLFGVRVRDGHAVYLERNPWHKPSDGDAMHIAVGKALARMQHRVRSMPPLEAGPGAYAIEEDADQARYDANGSDGHPVGEY